MTTETKCSLESNQPYYDHMSSLVSNYNRVGQGFKAKAFIKAMAIIKDIEVEAPKYDIGAHYGIGNSVVNEIKELSENGSTKRLIDLESNTDESTNSKSRDRLSGILKSLKK